MRRVRGAKLGPSVWDGVGGGELDLLKLSALIFMLKYKKLHKTVQHLQVKSTFLHKFPLCKSTLCTSRARPCKKKIERGPASLLRQRAGAY